MIVEYDGSEFVGWQKQAGRRSVQGCLEEALARITGTPVRIVGAGRTDSGVHAAGQVAHFDTQIERPTTEVVRSLNAVLSRDVAVRNLDAVPAHFHARYSATSRRYSYRLLTTATRSPLERWRSWHTGPLDEARMAAAAKALVGAHDFGQMGRALTPGGTTVRHVTALDMVSLGDTVRLEVEANAFLRHQVRRMVGLLVAVGRGAIPVALVGAAVAVREPLPPYRRAPAQGLCLERVTYPADPSQWRTKREAEDDNAGRE